MVDSLKTQAVFQFLRPDQVKAISDASETIRCHAGETVYERGARADHFFTVLEGEVALRLPGRGDFSIIIDQLAKKDDGSGEWMKVRHKRRTLSDVEIVKNQVTNALDMYNQDYNGWARKKTYNALDALDELDKLVAQGKMGTAARDKIQAYSDDIRAALESVEFQFCRTLLFEFGPHGTEFLVPAELLISWDEIIYSDALFWYSDGGSYDILDVIDLGYWIDEVNETVHFFIHHFSQYYYSRR